METIQSSLAEACQVQGSRTLLGSVRSLSRVGSQAEDGPVVGMGLELREDSQKGKGKVGAKSKPTGAIHGTMQPSIVTTRDPEISAPSASFAPAHGSRTKTRKPRLTSHEVLSQSQKAKKKTSKSDTTFQLPGFIDEEDGPPARRTRATSMPSKAPAAMRSISQGHEQVSDEEASEVQAPAGMATAKGKEKQS